MLGSMQFGVVVQVLFWVAVGGAADRVGEIAGHHRGSNF